MDIEKILLELTLEEKAGLCSGASFWRTKPVERLGVPPVMMCDGPHGLRKQKGQEDHLGINESIETVCYPTASALASSFDREVMASLGTALGEECQAENVAMLLGPGLNIKRSPLCGRNFEYFSEDPYLAGELAVAYIRNLQGQGVAACVKHFAANNQETHRMAGDSRVDERTLHEIYLPAFEAAVKKGKTRSVMCAYNAVNGSFCAENKELLTDILRDRWGFDGFVVTDWGAVKDRVKGLLAGLDLEMPGGRETNAKKIIAAVESGAMDEGVLDEAVRNILAFVRDAQEMRRLDATVDRKACAELAASIEQECAVLLKNDGVLPLRSFAKVAFIGEFAQVPRFQGGGSSHINAMSTPSALDAVREMGLDVTYAQGYRASETGRDIGLENVALEAAKAADVAVIFAGLPDAFETEGLDRDNLFMPENQNALIAAVAAVQKNTVVVLHTGSPVQMPWVDQVQAIMCMYLGGSGVGEATVKLLLGEANPSGKLAETWPLKVEDNPSFLNFPGEGSTVEYHEGVFVGYRYYDKKKMDVRYPFGHGLSYTQFAYSGLHLDKETMLDTDTLRVTCSVKNTGSSYGKEAVQLYVCDIESTVRRPIRELRGFEKLALHPGEEKEVCFLLDKRAFAYYEPKIHDWHVESGMFRVEIGASSRDIRLAGTVEVKSTVALPMVFTANTVIGDLMKHPQGQMLVAQMMAGRSNRAEAKDAETLGPGSSQAVQSMMQEMPLGSFVNFGLITEEQFNGMLAMLNGKA